MKYLSVVILTTVFFSHARSQGRIFTTDAGAIRGYDPVCYFTEAKPVKGSPDFTWEWREATWYFKSAENRDLFINDPEKYAPQFCGFCSFGISRNYKVKSEPDAWIIVDGKLYLNYNKEVQQKWLADRETFIQRALTNWTVLENAK